MRLYCNTIKFKLRCLSCGVIGSGDKETRFTNNYVSSVTGSECPTSALSLIKQVVCPSELVSFARKQNDGGTRRLTPFANMLIANTVTLLMHNNSEYLFQMIRKQLKAGKFYLQSKAFNNRFQLQMLLKLLFYFIKIWMDGSLLLNHTRTTARTPERIQMKYGAEINYSLE